MEMSDRINTYYPSMTKSEQKVARCVLEHPDNLIYRSVTELADVAGTERKHGDALLPQNPL